tara:strand:- start:2328 stop:5414 length:3087 start_codon:yes stop_codon:yes gene_type:complete
MAKTKQITIKGKKYIYKTVNQLSKLINKSPEKTKAIIKIDKFANKHYKKLKDIRFKGKKYNFKSPAQLAKKLNISDISAINLLNDYKSDKTIRYIKVNEKIKKFDLRKKPLMFQEFKKKIPSTKQLLGINKIKGVKIYKHLPKKAIYSVYLQIDFIVNYWVSDTDSGLRSFGLQSDIVPSELNKSTLADMVIEEYFSGAEPVNGISIVDYKVYNQQSGQEFKLINMTLKEHTPLNICNLFNEVVPNENSSNCVKNYLDKIWNKKRIPKRDKLLFDSLHTIDQLLNFCIQRNIKIVAYNIMGKVIASHYPEIKDRRHKNLIFIAYNNHLYPLKNQVLNKITIKKNPCKFQHTPNVDEVFKSFIKEGVLPANIKLRDGKLSSFICDKVHYCNNPDYEDCKKILEMYGLGDKIHPYITKRNVVNIVETVYLTEHGKKVKIDSFFPNANRFIKGGFLYKTDTEETELETIDKNKAYSHALTKLKFLIKVDIRTCKSYKLEEDEALDDHHLYLIKVSNSCVLLPKSGVYSGQHLNYCEKEEIEFTIVEGLETTICKNYLQQMITDLYDKLSPELFKECVNIYIGKFAHKREIDNYLQVNELANIEESECCDGVVVPYNKDYNFICEIEQKFNIYNRKPIHIQILDKSRQVAYRTMKKLKLKTSDIVQIKTDSITFKKNKYTTKKLKKIIGTHMNNWKYESYTPLKCPCVSNNILEGFTTKTISPNNTLTTAYAGAGKTHLIINEVLPNMKTSYIILTPSHATLKEYRKAKINCKVIQSYSSSFGDRPRPLPEEDTLIIDEIGMVDLNGCDFIYKCLLTGKNILTFGDYKQLLPVGSRSPYCSQLWNNLIYGKQKEMTTNYRNDFTQKYYDSLIKCKSRKYLLEQVSKYSSPVYDAEVIITYTNLNRHKYNKLMCDHLNIPYLESDKKIKLDPDNLKEGTSIICLHNDLRKKNIYNKFCYTIKSVDEEIIITDGLDDIEITPKELKYFDFGYARTVYSIQGASIESYHYAKEDYNWIDARTAYTLISRIKLNKK